MKLLTREELQELTSDTGDPAVSIYLPTVRAGKEIRQNPIRLKTLLGKAERFLEEKGLEESEIDEILAPARELLPRNAFWNQQSDGLAVFLSPGFFRYYRLPAPFEELVTVTSRFHVTPLIRLLSGNGRFFLLAFSKNGVRLLEATHFSIRKIDLPGVPENMEEALGIEEPQRRIQFHTGTAGGNGRRPAIFHGQGAGEDVENKYIRNYLRQIDRAVNRLVSGENAPLVLAAVEYLLPLYAEINTYPHLVDEGIRGNPDRLSEEELHKKAWPIIEPYFLRNRDRDAERFYHLREKKLAAAKMDEVVPAAYYGRVEALFAAVDEHCWGTFDPESERVECSDREEAGSEDLVDFAAAHTILKGGRVYPLSPEEMPDDSPLAAIYRY